MITIKVKYKSEIKTKYTKGEKIKMVMAKTVGRVTHTHTHTHTGSLENKINRIKIINKTSLLLKWQ